MSPSPDAALAYAHENRARFLEEFKELARIPSISTDPTARAEMQRAAEWLAAHMRALDLQHVTIYPTAGHPVVYGESLAAGPGKPTVLIYGHYDVQPAEPLDLWHSPAFEPEVRGDHLYARGAADMKGEVIACLKAVEALQRTSGLPVNVKFMLEGEEEIGSPSLKDFMRQHQELLDCDFALNSDSGILDADTPTLTYGLRGLAYFELRVSGPASDLHSGIFGGVVHNPAQALCELVAGMHDAQGRITLPGFYDSVRALSDEERQELNRSPLTDSLYLQHTGAPALHGEAGFTQVERLGARPTLEVNGLLSGYTGAGAKTVLPAKAMAKISCRLVPDQDPGQVKQQLLAYLEKNAPPTITWELEMFAGAFPSITDRHNPGVRAMHRAMEETWGHPPLYHREGGSVPVVAQMQDLLQVESVLMGMAMPDDNLHAPNEKIHLPTFYRGIDLLIRYLDTLGKDQA
jgi:acetylornithine deacetylase/succinyl-diaminopimelate desuccinylase-like protein